MSLFFFVNYIGHKLNVSKSEKSNLEVFFKLVPMVLPSLTRVVITSVVIFMHEIMADIFTCFLDLSVLEEKYLS